MTTLQPVVILLALVIISVICFLLHRRQRKNSQPTFSHPRGKRRSRSAPI